MFALPIFTVRGSDASAASGGYSELSEWQRSTRDDGACRRGHSSGTATGHLSSRRPEQSGGLFQAQKSLDFSVEASCVCVTYFHG